MAELAKLSQESIALEIWTNVPNYSNPYDFYIFLYYVLICIDILIFFILSIIIFIVFFIVSVP